MADSDTRVPIWNSYFKLAWDQAKAVHEQATGVRSTAAFVPLGGTLSDGEPEVLAAVVLCALAIEARTNHLIDELVENDAISNDTGQAARWLPPKEKWFLIPALSGRPTQLDSATGPHQAVAQVCDLRNDLLHVNYDGLSKRLPSKETMLSYFRRVVEAFEDMNVVLGRIDEPRQEVLRLGSFE